tara:strand:+ start:1255 stop:1428 length:174 start_codon:yes stop_codon:yes gene_type:complete
MNRIARYYRKRKHIMYVRGYVCELHNDIFNMALNGEVKLYKANLYKKWNRYLRILEL